MVPLRWVGASRRQGLGRRPRAAYPSNHGPDRLDDGIGAELPHRRDPLRDGTVSTGGNTTAGEQEQGQARKIGLCLSVSSTDTLIGLFEVRLQYQG